MRHAPTIILAAAVCDCGNEARVTHPAETRGQGASSPRYDVVTLPSLGGPASRGVAINNRGWVAGWAVVPATGSRVATL